MGLCFVFPDKEARLLKMRSEVSTGWKEESNRNPENKSLPTSRWHPP